MGFSFYFSSLYPAPYIELYGCKPIQIFYLNFRAVLVLPETASSAKTHKSMSFIWIVWSTLYVYLWASPEKKLWWKKEISTGKRRSNMLCSGDFCLKNFGCSLVQKFNLSLLSYYYFLTHSLFSFFVSGYRVVWHQSLWSRPWN